MFLGCGGPKADTGGGDTGEPADTAESDTGAWAVVAGASADGLGNALSAAGDPDADGRPDLLAAAYLGNRVCVIGPGLQPGANALDDVATACFVGETDTDYAGYGIAGVGDADNDGVDDVMIASIGNGDAGANAGKVYLVTGPVTSGTLGSAAAAWTGESSGDYAGTGIARAGDVTGDGVADYVIGASGYDGGGVYGGRAYLLAGPLAEGGALADADATVTGLGAPPAAPPHGAFGVGDFVGDAVLGPGDLDGDGIDDLALGASGDASAGPSTGKVAVFRGPVAGAWSVADADLTLAGVVAGGYAGSPIAAAGDVTGDGLADLWVSVDATGPGTVYLCAGTGTGTSPLDVAYASLVGEADGDLFGSALAAADADGDGVADLLVGAPYSEAAGPLTGSAYLFFGPFAAGSRPAADAVPFSGTPDVGSFGGSVALVDLDGTGTPEVVVGEYTSEAGGSFSGALHVFVW
jgi:hypothetical protein